MSIRRIVAGSATTILPPVQRPGIAISAAIFAIAFGLTAVGCASSATKTAATPPTIATISSVVPTTVVTTSTTAPTTAAVTTITSLTTTTTTTTTTVAPTTTTTTSAVATTQAGGSIGRDTALAATQCLDQWVSLQRYGRAGGFKSDDLDTMITTCDKTSDLLKVDQLGVPTGDSPVSTLALIIATINVNAFTAHIGYPSDSCNSGICALSASDKAAFLQISTTDAIASLIPTIFEGYVGGVDRTITLDAIPGLTVRP